MQSEKIAEVKSAPRTRARKSLVRQRLDEIPTDVHVPGEQTKAPPSEGKVKSRWTAPR